MSPAGVRLPSMAARWSTYRGAGGTMGGSRPASDELLTADRAHRVVDVVIGAPEPAGGWRFDRAGYDVGGPGAPLVAHEGAHAVEPGAFVDALLHALDGPGPRRPDPPTADIGPALATLLAGTLAEAGAEYGWSELVSPADAIEQLAEVVTALSVRVALSTTGPALGYVVLARTPTDLWLLRAEESDLEVSAVRTSVEQASRTLLDILEAGTSPASEPVAAREAQPSSTVAPQPAIRHAPTPGSPGGRSGTRLGWTIGAVMVGLAVIIFAAVLVVRSNDENAVYDEVNAQILALQATNTDLCDWTATFASDLDSWPDPRNPDPATLQRFAYRSQELTRKMEAAQTDDERAQFGADLHEVSTAWREYIVHDMSSSGSGFGWDLDAQDNRSALAAWTARSRALVDRIEASCPG